jgi:hypothetical protein
MLHFLYFNCECHYTQCRCEHCGGTNGILQIFFTWTKAFRRNKLECFREKNLILHDKGV